MTCVPNDLLSVYQCPVFHMVICTDTSVNIREKQNVFGVLVTQDILHTCSIYIILAKLCVQYSRFSSLLHLIKG